MFHHFYSDILPSLPILNIKGYFTHLSYFIHLLLGPLTRIGQVAVLKPSPTSHEYWKVFPSITFLACILLFLYGQIFSDFLTLFHIIHLNSLWNQYFSINTTWQSLAYAFFSSTLNLLYQDADGDLFIFKIENHFQNLHAD